MIDGNRGQEGVGWWVGGKLKGTWGGTGMGWVRTGGSGGWVIDDDDDDDDDDDASLPIVVALPGYTQALESTPGCYVRSLLSLRPTRSNHTIQSIQN